MASSISNVSPSRLHPPAPAVNHPRGTRVANCLEFCFDFEFSRIPPRLPLLCLVAGGFIAAGLCVRDAAWTPFHISVFPPTSRNPKTEPHRMNPDVHHLLTHTAIALAEAVALASRCTARLCRLCQSHLQLTGSSLEATLPCRLIRRLFPSQRVPLPRNGTLLEPLHTAGEGGRGAGAWMTLNGLWSDS